MSTELLDLAWPDRDGHLHFATVAGDEVSDAAGEIAIDPEEIGWPGVPGPLRPLPDGSLYGAPHPSGRSIQLCTLLGADGEPSPACSRSVLRRATHAAAEVGLSVIAAAEIEMFLVGDDGRPVYEAIDNYAIVRAAPYEHVLRAVRALAASGIPVIGTNTEYSGGQFEVNLRHGAALEAADAVCLAKSSIAAVAGLEGFGVTFAAKPWPEHSGSGLHWHQSCWRGEKNAFREDGSLSGPGRAYLAGLLAGIAELSPLGSPTALAYTRRSDGSFCPINASWGEDNRTTAVRSMVEGEGGTRVEQRDAASDANPHLSLAGQVHAGLAGINAKLELPEPVEGNAYADASLPKLPRTLDDALSKFRHSELGRSVLGATAHASFVASLEGEAEAGLAGLAVTDPDGGW